MFDTSLGDKILTQERESLAAGFRPLEKTSADDLSGLLREFINDFGCENVPSYKVRNLSRSMVEIAFRLEELERMQTDTVIVAVVPILSEYCGVSI